MYSHAAASFCPFLLPDNKPRPLGLTLNQCERASTGDKQSLSLLADPGSDQEVGRSLHHHIAPDLITPRCLRISMRARVSSGPPDRPSRRTAGLTPNRISSSEKYCMFSSSRTMHTPLCSPDLSNNSVSSAVSIW